MKHDWLNWLSTFLVIEWLWVQTSLRTKWLKENPNGHGSQEWLKNRIELGH